MPEIAMMRKPDIQLFGRIKVVAHQVEGKAAALDAQGRLNIRALVSTPSLDLQGHIVEPRAFYSSMPKFKERPVMLAYHDMAQPVGRWPEQTIEDSGVTMQGFISSGRPDIQQLVIDGVLDGASIGYNRVDGGRQWDEELEVLRITDLDLWEVSLVPLPANEDTYVEVSKAMSDWLALEVKARTPRRESPLPPPAEEPGPAMVPTVVFSDLVPLVRAAGRMGNAIAEGLGQLAVDLD